MISVDTANRILRYFGTELLPQEIELLNNSEDAGYWEYRVDRSNLGLKIKMLFSCSEPFTNLIWIIIEHHAAIYVMAKDDITTVMDILRGRTPQQFETFKKLNVWLSSQTGIADLGPEINFDDDDDVEDFANGFGIPVSRYDNDIPSC